jgi:UDP-N-acetylmuramate dehydrogenase
VNLRDALPPVRGKLLFDEPLAPFTWFRVGGPADALFLPADQEDLGDLLRGLPGEIPKTVLGVGSNVIVRDGGIEGVVIRLAGRAFGDIHIDAENGRVIAGSGALDAAVARAAAEAGVGGVEFLAGIPGTIGGALTMNAGCYGRETKDVLIAAHGVDSTGEYRSWELEDFGYGYRTSAVPAGMFWDQAVFQGHPDDPAAIRARMAEITARREATQPLREKTGGSTFKNPPGHSAWRLVDEAGWRGRPLGGAMMSPLHANFMINTGVATAAELEALGEAVRADVAAKTGVELDWEIKRVGRPVVP